jgi:hypothetical protein
MPPTTQRRNTAYLNRRISRFGRQDRNLDDQTPISFPDLRLISRARSTNAFDPTRRPVRACGCDEDWAARDRREKYHALLRLVDLCVLTVELSGAHAVV